MGEAVIRRGGATDVEPAVAVWAVANAARREGVPPRPEQAERARGHVDDPEAVLFVADDAGEVVGMALGEQALSDDGSGPPVDGLCHVSMVFVAPDRWGEGLGGRLVDALLEEVRRRGYERAQLWTQMGNARARRLYEGRGFRPSEREKDGSGKESFITRVSLWRRCDPGRAGPRIATLRPTLTTPSPSAAAHDSDPRSRRRSRRRDALPSSSRTPRRSGRLRSPRISPLAKRPCS
jgi:ribosomal protein S18 acetylase RimI-like enzyme